MRIGVVADDLTGAGDAALAFERRGLPAEIGLWGPTGPPPAPGGRAAVWVLDTDSRSSAPRAARERVRRAVLRLKRWKAGFIFKKIDSTLRGPLGAELDGFLEALRPGAPVAFVPAFPAMGRTTAGGRHFVDGVPLHRTPFGRDPRHPLKTDAVAALLGRERVGKLWIPDAPDQAALRRAAEAVAAGRGVFSRAAVGSAGFAEALAGFLGKRRERRPRFVRPKRPGGGARAGTVLFVSGSAHPRSRAQAEALKGRRGVVVVTAPLKRGDPRAVLRDVTRRALKAEKEFRVRRFAVTGGETAAALARAWGASRWRVLGEVERGAPLCLSRGSRPAREMVMKPGGFGGDDIWLKTTRIFSRP